AVITVRFYSKLVTLSAFLQAGFFYICTQIIKSIMTIANEGMPGIPAVNHLLRSRRSVFPDQFEKGKIIPEEIILELLENANWAPNHKNTEPWRFIVFTGNGLKKLATYQANRYKEREG